jgi:hypothetical protein
MPDKWYEAVEASSPLTQGDFIFDCPLLSWKLTSETAGTPEELKSLVEVFREDVVVMTQACDLEFRKVENVVLCPHVSISDFRKTWADWMKARNQNPSEKAWKQTCQDIADGYVWNQALLEQSTHSGLTMEIRVVDFHDVFTVPRTFLASLLASRQSTRLRLLPPYREHLSQAFARFFMRVGLPQPITPAW